MSASINSLDNNDECMTYDKFFVEFSKLYKDTETVLSAEEEEILDKTALFIKNIYGNKIQFNENKFKELIRKLVPDNAMYGGDGDSDDNRMVEVKSNSVKAMENPQPTQRVFNLRNDFFAVLGVVGSLFLAYWLYVQILDIDRFMKDNGFDLAEAIKAQAKVIEDELYGMPDMSDIVDGMDDNERSYYRYLINLFSRIRCGIENKALEGFKTLLMTQIANVGIEFENAVRDQCSTAPLLDKDWGIFGQFVNKLGVGVSSIAGNAGICVQESAKLALKQKLLDYEKILNTFNYKVSSIKPVFMTALSLGYTCGGYLVFRITQKTSGLITELSNRYSVSNEPDEERMIGDKNRQLGWDKDKGGSIRKSRKSRKSKKSKKSKKSRKSRKSKKSKKSKKSRRR